ncbi:30S ribosomal protein S11 [Candidatus Azoamicus ciliaticola]|uniref:Small ribosomal subunit protein uS11 n=1 Tax=Candidatus Azoamicus ciliaticola TaxID=2652803 RepID=A0A6J5JWQ0_9GAMM|nr:30S ribosomal protein S11 [Candidatus Azoamicus ciliaticola]CAB3976365.1 30S ribosomal protein S11 [Candidatus Azoamicus ciliaticola]
MLKKLKNKTVKKSKKQVTSGKIYIKASYNNTLIYITDLIGDVLLWKTAGSEGFKGSKKSTPYAAQVASKSVSKIAKEVHGLTSVEVYVSGPGPGREAAIRGLANFLKVTYIADVTSIPHNGCRPAKERRV